MAFLMGQTAHAAGFPDRGVKIVVPFPAGGSNDVVARLLGTKLSEMWGQPVVIDNRAGGGGNIGAEAVARSPADGYTLLLAAPGPLAVNQSLYAQLSFNPEQDFTPVALIASVPIVLAVNPAVKAKTVAELIALAKASPGCWPGPASRPIGRARCRRRRSAWLRSGCSASSRRGWRWRRWR